VRRVPEFPQRRLTPDQRRRLHAATKGIEQAEKRWAELVKKFGLRRRRAAKWPDALQAISRR
jgi:hypothetical protein